MTGKRIVLAAEFWFGATGSGLAHGLRKQGWDVHELDMQSFFLQRGSLPARLAARLMRRWNVHAYNAAILQAVDQMRAHAFLTVKGLWLLPETLRQIAARSVASVMYYPDFHFEYDGLDQATFPLYDHFLTTKSFQLDHLQKLLDPSQVTLVHHGYSDLVHRPLYPAVTEEKYAADVTYIGNHTRSKERWVRAIADRLPDLRFRIVGHRWDSIQDLRRRSLGYVLAGDFYARAAQVSRINIAFHAGPTAPGEWEDLVSTRTFEIPACKGFMLHIDNAEVRTLFEAGREIDVFANEDELIDKITYYLARPELRRQMIERAYARCVPAYGYAARAKAISDKLDALLGERTVQQRPPAHPLAKPVTSSGGDLCRQSGRS